MNDGVTSNVSGSPSHVYRAGTRALAAFAGFLQFVVYFLTFGQRLEGAALHCRAVEEYIRPFLRANETEPTILHNFLDRPTCHCKNSLDKQTKSLFFAEDLLAGHTP